MVRTLFRDPVNLKKRRQAEILNNIEECKVEENTALSVILNPDLKDTFFYCEDLIELHKLKGNNYKNANNDWMNLYNATLVMPISQYKSDLRSRFVEGFICVDNMNGNITDNSTIELLKGISDLLYNYILKYDEISLYCKNNNLKNEKEREFKFRH